MPEYLTNDFLEEIEQNHNVQLLDARRGGGSHILKLRRVFTSEDGTEMIMQCNFAKRNYRKVSKNIVENVLEELGFTNQERAEILGNL